MTNRDLSSLKDLPVPAARETARRAAIDAAMAAFDSAEKNTGTPQGTGAGDRPTPASHPAMRRKFMSFTRSQYALAASIAALMIAAPAAFNVMQSDRHRQAFDPMQAAAPAKVQPALEPEPIAGEKAGDKGDIASSRSQEPSAPAASTTVARQDQPADEKKSAEAGADADSMTSVDDLLRKTPEAEAVTNRQELAESPAPSPAAELAKSKKVERHAGLPSGGRNRMLAEIPVLAPPPPTHGLGAISGNAGPRSIDGRISAAPTVAALDSAKPYEADLRRTNVDQEFRDKFDSKDINPVKQVAAEPVSTFSIDVDTASYAFVRRALNSGTLPPKDAIRVEEMINYFPYDYAKPDTAETPFKPTVTVLPSPWNAGNQLVHVAIKGYDIQATERPRANLVFLIDVSGSMESSDKLPLVKNAFRMLVDELKPDDTVAIVTYASGSGICLEPTNASDKAKILAAVDSLGAGGSTAGAEGIQDAYRLAESNFDKSAVNRVILATDGDFNVGVTDHDDLKGLIERKREKGIFLSILGVGQGNYNDALMQTLAQNGNGTAAYVDTLNEARKVLVDEASSTLFTIAKDVKAQIEWNPARVAEYRLVGYETRALKREDFNNDKVDAGDIGSGHTVTAIYEVTPAGSSQKLVDDLRYAKPEAARREPAATTTTTVVADGEIGFLKLRYKLPKEDASKLVTLAINDGLAKDTVATAPAEARFSIAVAAFGQLLKGAPYLKVFGYDDVIGLAQSAKGEDRFGYRAEFINLVRLAKSARP
ncbi:MAG: YfbK domain-containing protein [Hyphomicrobium sp.]